MPFSPIGKTRSTSKIKSEQPLIVGAVGLTIGATIGASLPRSRKENEVMGEASDSFKATVAGTAREQFAHVEQAGGRIVEKVRGEAEDHGLTSDSTQALVRDIGAKVSAVAAASKEGAEDELKSASGRIERRAFRTGGPSRTFGARVGEIPGRRGVKSGTVL